MVVLFSMKNVQYFCQAYAYKMYVVIMNFKSICMHQVLAGAKNVAVGAVRGVANITAAVAVVAVVVVAAN